MLRESILSTLNAIFAKGFWETPGNLMGEALSCYPGDFSSLREADALRVIDYANKFLCEADEAPIFCEDHSGRCVDLWEKMDAPRKPGRFRFGDPSKDLPKFGKDGFMANGGLVEKFSNGFSAKKFRVPHPDELSQLRNDKIIHKYSELINENPFGTITGRIEHTNEPSLKPSVLKDFKSFEESKIELNAASTKTLAEAVTMYPRYERWIDVNTGSEMVSKINSKGDKRIIRITSDTDQEEIKQFFSEDP